VRPLPLPDRDEQENGAEGGSHVVGDLDDELERLGPRSARDEAG
jgi:hypothetical protein